ncbi:MAG TPA: hypothetical protein VN328_06305 [Thermodesulfovibrionales bacterium]|nr:hypothetical protein [Thermodesulfovibrionales bacterium]
MEKGLSNTEPYSYLLMDMARKDRVRAREFLSLARKYSPDLPIVYFELARAGLSPSADGIFQGLDYFRQGVRAYGRNFWWGFTIAGLLYASLFLSFLFSLLLLLIIRLVMDTGLFLHDGTEDRKRLLLLFVPIIGSFFGPIGLIAGLLFLVGLYFKKENKAVVYASLVVFLLSPMILRVGETFFSAPSADLRAVVAVNEGRDNGYALRFSKGRNDFASKFSYALALKRVGRYEEAIEIYKSLTGRPYKQDPRVYINLGNTYRAIGDTEAARSSYLKSIDIGPRPAAFYDLSQIHREMLDFEKGDEYFIAAAKLDPEAVSRFASAASVAPSRFVADETLSISALWGYAMARGNHYIHTLGILIAVIALGMICGFYFLDRNIQYRGHRCKRCGDVFCGKCSRALTWGEMCPRCFTSLIKIEEVDSKERIARLLSICQSQTRRRNIAKAISLLVPGGGQIYSGRMLSGLLLLWPFLFAATLLVLSGVPLAGLVPFDHGWVRPFAILFMGILYVVSVLNLKRRISRGWL